MGRGVASQLRKAAGTRSIVELLVAWMFMLVSLFLFCALERFDLRHKPRRWARPVVTLSDRSKTADHISLKGPPCHAAQA
jgi:hypothetical protein